MVRVFTQVFQSVELVSFPRLISREWRMRVHNYARGNREVRDWFVCIIQRLIRCLSLLFLTMMRERARQRSPPLSSALSLPFQPLIVTRDLLIVISLCPFLSRPKRMTWAFFLRYIEFASVWEETLPFFPPFDRVSFPTLWGLFLPVTVSCVSFFHFFPLPNPLIHS